MNLLICDYSNLDRITLIDEAQYHSMQVPPHYNAASLVIQLQQLVYYLFRNYLNQESKRIRFILPAKLKKLTEFIRRLVHPLLLHIKLAKLIKRLSSLKVL